ncbi:Uncharacterized protein DAT39_018609, partial [Clarias magur]
AARPGCCAERNRKIRSGTERQITRLRHSLLSAQPRRVIIKRKQAGVLSAKLLYVSPGFAHHLGDSALNAHK